MRSGTWQIILEHVRTCVLGHGKHSRTWQRMCSETLVNMAENGKISVPNMTELGETCVPENGETWQNMAEHGGIWWNMADHGGTWQNIIEYDGT